MNKIIFIVLIVIVLAGGAFFLLKKHNSNNTQAPATTTPTQQTQAPSSSKNIVQYTDSGFSPQSLMIKKGDTVTWVNQSSNQMWVASDPHPIHTAYPESGGCIGSKFDECSGVSKGSSYSFTFNKIGIWGYHNHLSPSDKGTITVQ